MKAVIVDNHGDSMQQLRLAEVATPIPVDNQVLIKVKYASLNPVDYKLIANQPAFWNYPYVVGLDMVDEIVELGSGVTRFKIGEMVATHGNLTYGGALAEYCVQPEQVLFKIPSGFDVKLAAALPCAGLTAYQALVRKMNIHSGKTIFIQAGSGGVGSFAIVIAKAKGLRVITSCSATNADYVKALGADEVIDYRNQDVYAWVCGHYPDGVDYILETTTKDNLQRDIEILAFNGQIASIVGVLETSIVPEFKTGFGFHEVALGGAYLSNHYPSQCDLAQMGDELILLLQQAKVVLQINSYRLDNFQQAFTDLQNSKNPGKIVIEVS